MTKQRRRTFGFAAFFAFDGTGFAKSTRAMQNQNDTPSPPMQTGANAQESERLVEEIQNTGVVESQDAAQATPAHDENVTDGVQMPSEPAKPIRRA